MDQTSTEEKKEKTETSQANENETRHVNDNKTRQATDNNAMQAGDDEYGSQVSSILSSFTTTENKLAKSRKQNIPHLV